MKQGHTSRLLTAGLAAATVLSGIASPALAADIKRGGTLSFARGYEPESLDPYLPSDNGSIYAIELICDSLIESNDDGSGYIPAIAESWTTSEDGMSYTFKLRDTVFSDGSKVTAEDAVFSLEQVRKDASPMAALFKSIDTVTAVDDETVAIQLNTPYSALLSALSMYAAAIVSKAAYEADAEKFATAPVCAGQFIPQDFSLGSDLRLAPNPDYWVNGEDGQPLPYLDEVVIRYVPESNGRVLGLRNGDFDLIADVPYNAVAQLEADPNITVEERVGYRLDYVFLNHAKAPLDDKRIRMALNYAANREAILKAVYFGHGEIPNSYMPKMNFWSPDVETIPYDPDKAAALVKEAGYDGTPIEIIVDSGNAPARQIATILQQGWSNAGLNVEIIEYEAGTSFEKVDTGEYTAWVSYVTSDMTDDDELATQHADPADPSRGLFSNYDNPEAGALIKRARESHDSAERAELYKQVQQMVYHDGYSVPLNFVPTIHAYDDNVHGFLTLPTGYWRLSEVWLDQ
jgi:peptide/nickel transport system substrate-binding protein